MHAGPLAFPVSHARLATSRLKSLCASLRLSLDVRFFASPCVRPSGGIEPPASAARWNMYRSCRWGALSLRAAALLRGRSRFPYSGTPAARRIAVCANAQRLCPLSHRRGLPSLPRFPSLGGLASLALHRLPSPLWARFARPRHASPRADDFPTVGHRGSFRSPRGHICGNRYGLRRADA